MTPSDQVLADGGQRVAAAFHGCREAAFREGAGLGFSTMRSRTPSMRESRRGRRPGRVSTAR
jgi:hypothetical protein